MGPQTFAHTKTIHDSADGFTRRPSIRRAILLGCVCLLYWRVFHVFFAVDDFGFLLRATQAACLPPGLADVFVNRYFSSDLLYRLGYAVFGTNAAGFHLVPAILHLVNAELVFVACVRLIEDRRVAEWASVLFAVHPAVYAPMAWLAAGFNEFPVLTLTLSSVLLLQSDVRSPALWKLLGMACCLVIATGFKQHAVLMPVYWLGVGGYLYLTRRASVAAIRRLVVVAVLLAPFYAYLWVAVLPRMRTLFAGPYERVFEFKVFAETLLGYVLAALNPLPFLREPLGGQLPWMSVADQTALGRTAGGVVTAAIALSCMSGPKASRQRVLVCGSGVVLAVLLALPATMPGHVYEYYLYSAIPVASLILALTLPTIPASFLGGGRTRLALLIACATGALWASGQGLHASSSIVAQAGRARAIDDAVRLLPDGTEIVVVPPSDGAHEDTAFGVSVAALHGERGTTIRFARPEDPLVRSGIGRQLLAVDRDGTAATVRFVDNAQWAEGGPVVVVTGQDGPMRDTVSVGAGQLEAIQLPVEVLGRVNCRIVWVLTTSTGEAVTTGALPCGGIAGPFSSLAIVGGIGVNPGQYVLGLKAEGEGVVRLRTASAPERGRGSHVGDPGTGTAGRLVHRVITKAPFAARQHR